MSFGQAISSFWANYVNFEGRARRSEYWFIALFLFLTNLGALILDGAFGSLVVVQTLWLLAAFIPSLAVSVRRLHDTGRSGWWLLIALVPIAGFIVLLVFTLQDSDSGDNVFGPNPKIATATN